MSWGWRKGRSGESWREAEDPASSKAEAGGCSSLLCPHPLLTASQISAFPPSHYASRAAAAKQQVFLSLGSSSCLGCPISATMWHPACPRGCSLPLWRERSTGKATCAVSAAKCPWHTRVYIWRDKIYIFPVNTRDWDWHTCPFNSEALNGHSNDSRSCLIRQPTSRNWLCTYRYNIQMRPLFPLLKS